MSARNSSVVEKTSTGPKRAKQNGMNWYDRLSQYHAQHRPSFILFTELAAFLGTMVTMVGMAILRSLLS